MVGVNCFLFREWRSDMWQAPELDILPLWLTREQGL